MDIFSLVFQFSFLSPSLWETARYRLKYCLKEPLSQKQSINRSHAFLFGPLKITLRFHALLLRFRNIIFCSIKVPYNSHSLLFHSLKNQSLRKTLRSHALFFHSFKLVFLFLKIKCNSYALLFLSHLIKIHFLIIIFRSLNLTFRCNAIVFRFFAKTIRKLKIL